jgi:hypothetical protein
MRDKGINSTQRERDKSTHRQSPASRSAHAVRPVNRKAPARLYRTRRSRKVVEGWVPKHADD